MIELGRYDSAKQTNKQKQTLKSQDQLVEFELQIS